MTLLHDFFNLRNRQAFQRLLDGSDRGSAHINSGTSGKPWNRAGPSTSPMALDVNARDWLGRTVLHLACASPEDIEYVRLLLRHQHINVNIPDTESHWTPLHRALYQANFPAALLLLQRIDIDRSLQDFEGYTAFDLYNSTINGTKPSSNEPFAELYTWGVNRNAVLGLGDGSDRMYPDQVVIQREDDYIGEREGLSTRFSPILVRQIQMSKLHTAVVTSENSGNLRVCGFGSGGRLGPGQHTQYSPKIIPQFTQTIVSVALGQDHTLALTKSGEVLSWGLNRFSQLGYVVENTHGEGFGRIDEPIQFAPKKIHGPLRKEFIKGIAASKGASACWTCSDVYTWGTNNGQLGYDRAAQPVQVLPRKVSKIAHPVLAISLTDSAMACLLETHDVVCIWNDRQIKISFPGHAFPPEIRPHRPPDAVQDAKVAKITSCENTFAALSFNGELFTFSVPNVLENDGAPGKGRSVLNPQRVWALRKKFSAVKDVALGSDGSIIVCTESGHVFVRSRNTKASQTTSGKTSKFQRVPYLQRVTQVSANSTGAFGALRAEHRPNPIEVRGNGLAQDLAEIQPYLFVVYTGVSDHTSLLYSKHSSHQPPTPVGKSDEEIDDLCISNDVRVLQQLLDVLASQRKPQPKSATSSDPLRLPYGADVIVHGSSGTLFPAHCVILGARSSVLYEIMSASRVVQDTQSGISLRVLNNKVNGRGPMKLAVVGCHPISILILLRYIYSDDLLAIWDGRISAALESQLLKAKIQPAQIKSELRSFATLLDFPHLAQPLESPVKRKPNPSMVSAMEYLFGAAQKLSLTQKTIFSPDVILQLADKEIRCHSVILRARSVFFADFFTESVWTMNRWDPSGIIKINMKHLSWRVMDYILRFMCCGADQEMFHILDSALFASVDDILEFMFDVMAAANELLLDRLVLICSSVILNHLTLNRACFILSDATYLHAEELIERLQTYITVNMELFLTTGMLDEIPPYLIDNLAHFARQKQAEKSPVSRSNHLALRAMATHSEWLALQDIPHPIPRTHVLPRKNSSNFKSSQTGTNPIPTTPLSSDAVHQSPGSHSQSYVRHPQFHEDIFAMDDVNGDPTSRSAPLSTSPTPYPAVWKAPSKPRVDMIAVMAEAASASALHHPQGTVTRGTLANTPKDSPKRQHDLRSTTDLAPRSSSAGLSRPPSISNWKSIEDAIPRPQVNGPTPTMPLSGTSRERELQLASPNSSPGSRLHASQTPSRQPRISPNMGPLITPSRQSTSSTNPYALNIRRTSGNVWNQPAVKPVSTLSASTSGMSILAIQQLELDQIAGLGKEKLSLREIQEEEKSLQEEADFLTWWTAEEARIKLENEALNSPRNRSKQPGKRSRRKAGEKDGTPVSKTSRPQYTAHKQA